MPINKAQLKQSLPLINEILQTAKIATHPCFISYAWENGEDNVKLQTWLSDLKEDLEMVGIKTFLDIDNMHGKMKPRMEENIEQSGFVLLIGTPKFKERVEQDRLYKIPRNIFDLMWPPSTATDINPKIDKKDIKGKAIVLIDNDGNIEDNVYFIEEGKILHKERTLGKKLNIESISWSKMGQGIYIADISRKVNDIIGQAKQEADFFTQKRSETFGSSINNVAFEFGFTLEKGKGDASALIPLLCKGEFISSFPVNIFKEDLIRDIRREEDYGNLLVGLSNPMGIIPAICPQLTENKDYKKLITSLLNSPEEELSNEKQAKFGRRATTFSSTEKGDSSQHKGINDEGEAVINLTMAPTDFSTQEKIGEGSFGEVYKGEWEGTTVAIKKLRAGKMPDRILSEFKNEAFIMAKYRHPNIVQLYGICLTQPYSMIMEFLVNGSLFYYLYSDKVLEWQRKYKIAKDVAAGLSFLHKRNVIHRDIKSLNLFLDQELNAKIGDYGLATIKTYSDNTTAAVGSKKNVGTISWKAPELFKKGGVCSSASDVYSYGMLLWEIASHKMPFEGLEIDIVKFRIEDGETEIIPPNCPASFSEIINLCWHQVPELRADINTVLQKLTQLMSLPFYEISAGDTLSDFVKNHTKSFKKSSSIGYVSKTKTHDSIDNSDLRLIETGQTIPLPSDEIDILKAGLTKANIQDKAPEREVKLKAEQEAKAKAEREAKLKEEQEAKAKIELQPVLFAVKAKPKPVATSTIIPQEVMQFLHHVGYGEQAEAEAMLQKDKNLALAHGDLTDCSVEPKTYQPRTWKNITGFQYAVLALDYHMWTMIQKYISTEDASQQIAEIKTKATLTDKEGWKIKLGNKDWLPIGWTSLIEALDIYIKNCCQLTEHGIWTQEQCDTHWCQQVGGAQLILPAHIINEYSHPSRPFYPCPKWQGEGELILPRTGVVDWINNSGKKLGSNFGWVKCYRGYERQIRIAVIAPESYGRHYRYDYLACVELLKSRTEQAQTLVFKNTSGQRNVPRP